MTDKIAKTGTATKLPQVTLVFWIMKIAATTVGETGGDMLAQTLKVGYGLSTLILLSVFLVTLVAQLRARTFSPALYWTVIVSTSTAGTTISDYMDRTLEFGYFKGTLILVSLLISALVFWKVKFGSISINRVHGFELELMYWTTILCSNTLGTALGDYLSDSSGLGFGGSALLIASLIAVVAVLHFRTSIDKMVLFWAAFVLTRPLGATVGDLFTKPPSKGGLGFGTYGATAVLVAVLVGLIVKTNRDGATTIAAGAAADVVRQRSAASPVPQSRARRRPARSRRTARASARLNGRAPTRSTVTSGSAGANPESRDAWRAGPADGTLQPVATTPLTGPDDQVGGDIGSLLKVAAESAARIQADAEAMAERVRREAAAFAEQQRAIARRLGEAWRVHAESAEQAAHRRSEAAAEIAALRHAAEIEAAEVRANAEREAMQLIGQAKAQAAGRTAQAERRVEDLRAAETALIGRLQQADLLWQALSERLRPEPRPQASAAIPASHIEPSLAHEPLADLEPAVTQASTGNGAH